LAGKQSVADGDAADVQALDLGLSWIFRIDHLQAAAAQVDMIAGSLRSAERSGGQGDQPSFFLAGKHQDRSTEDFGSRLKESFSVSGSAKGASADGHHFGGAVGGDFFLEEGEHLEGAANRGGLEPTGDSDAFPKANGIGLLVEDAQDAFLLLGEEQLEGVGAKVEHGTADRHGRHPSVKAGRKKVGNWKEGSGFVLF